MNEQAALLSLEGLTVSRTGAAKPVLDRLSLSIGHAERLVVLGEDGCGKEALVQLLSGYVERGEDVSGTVRVRNGAGEKAGRRMPHGIRIAVMPGPYTRPLSPNAPALSQFVRIVARKLEAPKSTARAEFDLALQRLSGAPPLATFEKSAADIDPELMAWGLLACCLAQTPDLLVADDPFSRLGPAQGRAAVTALMAEQKRTGFALLYAAMTTELARWIGGRLIVMRTGKVIEEGSVAKLSGAQAHSYTRTLFKSLPLLTDARPRAAGRGEPVLQVYGLSMPTREKTATPRRREAMNFELRRGASLALVGERGSGRRSFPRVLLGLEPAQSGRVVLDAVDIGILSEQMKTRLRRRVAFISGADDALDPRMTLWDTVDEPLRAHLRIPRDVLAQTRDAALRRVGLASMPGGRRVGTLSAFDRRRLQIARAIVSAPLLAIVDEPLRGLDAFARSVLRDLLREFREQEGPAFLVITADFTVARALSEEVMVIEDGQVIERGALTDVLKSPQEAYTKMLIEAVSASTPPGLSPRAASV